MGFYFDSHDLDALRDRLLVPFRRGAGSSVVTAVFDEPTDAAIDAEARAVGADDVLLFDGIFVQRPELREFWDLVVFLDAAQRVNLQRLELVLSDLPTTPIDIVGHVLEWGARIDRYASGMRYYLDVVDHTAVGDDGRSHHDHPVVPARDQQRPAPPDHRAGRGLTHADALPPRRLGAGTPYSCR